MNIKENILFNETNFVLAEKTGEDSGKISAMYYKEGENESDWTKSMNFYVDTTVELSVDVLENKHKNTLNMLTSKGAKLIHDYTSYSKDDTSKPTCVAVLMYPFPDKPIVDIKKMSIDSENHLNIIVYSAKMNPDEIEQYSTDSIELSGKLLDLSF